MKVAVVVQRYGKEVLGGAESHARKLITELSQRLHWQFEVFTTCALDYRSWANHYPAGQTYDASIVVHRFATAATRSNNVFSILSRLLFFWLKFARRGLALPIPMFLESLWFKLQGPYSPELIFALKRRENDFDFVICFTYLYHPTLATSAAITRPILLIPTAHREPPFFFRSIRKLFRRASHIATNGVPETHLISSLDASLNSKMTFVGIGFDLAEAGSSPKLEPVALYMGRISAGKGIGELLSHWSDAKIRENFGLELELAGTLESSVTHAELSRSGAHLLGFVEETNKYQTLKRATLVVNPSPHESLSMLVLEALFAGTPVLCTARCDVFRYYASEIPLCFIYEDVGEFQKKVAEILQMRKNSPRFTEMQEQSRAWVQKHYSWEVVTEKFRKIAAQITENSELK